MKKRVLFGVLILGMSEPVSGGSDFVLAHQNGGGNDTIQPIGPVSDNPGTTVLPVPGVTTVVPERSTLSLLAGAGVLSS